MRGNGVSFGFPEISLIGARMEAAAGARGVARVGKYLTELEAWIVKTNETANAEPRTTPCTRGRAAIVRQVETVGHNDRK
jgi:hypothetical protein